MVVADAAETVQVVADVGTFLAAIATVVLVFLTRKTLRALDRQIEVGQDAAESARSSAVAARESADAAAEAVREAAKTRIDDQAPSVLVLLEQPQWPPFVDRHRSGPPGGGDRTLLESMGQSEVAGPELYYFDAQKSWFLWFRTRGVLINEGRGAAKVQMPLGSRMIEGTSPLVAERGTLPIPPKVTQGLFPQYLLRSGEAALFEWGDGHTLGDWADACENAHPPNPHGTCFLELIVTDWLSAGVIDHHHVLLQGRPIHPVPGMQGQWRITERPEEDVAVVAFWPNRTYRAYHQEGTEWPAPAWQETFAEWHKQHGF